MLRCIRISPAKALTLDGHTGIGKLGSRAKPLHKTVRAARIRHPPIVGAATSFAGFSAAPSPGPSRDGAPTGRPTIPPLELPGTNSFGQDHRGELYALLMEGQVSRLDPA